MPLIGKFCHRVVEIPSQLVGIIRARVEDGERLITAAVKNEASMVDLAAWVFEFHSVVRQIDHRGEEFSGSLSMVWHDAQYFSAWDEDQHYNAKRLPKNDEERLVVFGQYLGVAKSLIHTGQATVILDDTSVQESCVFHRRTLDQQDNLVFVLMPFGEPWSDYMWRREIKPIVEGFSDFSLICRRADDLFGQDIMIDVYESIVTARILIAELTGRNANVFYELGMAHALGKDVILLSQGTDHIPFDLNRFRHCIYSNDGPGYDKLRAYLPSAIRSILPAQPADPADSE